MLETRLPFIALNVTRRSLGSVPHPTHFIISNGPAGGDEVFFPIAFQQMDNTLPAVLGAPQSQAGGLPAFLCCEQP